MLSLTISTLAWRSKAPVDRSASLTVWITSLLLVAAIPAASAGLAINLGDITIPAGSATCNVDVMVTGGNPVTDMVAYFQVGDGGLLFGGSAGPKITSIDLTGSIWSAAAGGFIRSDTITYPTQFQELNVSLNVAGQTVSGSGRLCRLVLNTAGFSGTFTLKMTATLGGATEFRSGAAVVPAAIVNGNLTIGASLPPPVAPYVAIQRLAGTMRLSFPAETGRSYTIQWNDDLTPPWTTITPSLTGSTGTTLHWTDDGTKTGTSPALVPKRFYRVLVN